MGNEKQEKKAPAGEDWREFERLLEKIACYRRSKGVDWELMNKFLAVNFSQDEEILLCQR